jgi:hypothetical protein
MRRPTTTAAPRHTARPLKLLFGIGSQAIDARSARLVQEAPVRMLTSWYNGPADLSWMTAWKSSVVPRSYAQGYALHLIVWTDVPEGRVQTQYGPACGRPYPVSSRFLDDMRQLAQTFAGPTDGPPFYVTLFTEFQTYPCTDNTWNASPAVNAYYRALQDSYLAALKVFHSYAPNARVSLGWGGWQTRWDAPATGGGRSLFRYFADAMSASDFQSFQAMGPDNAEDVRAMVKVLGAYGPVMLAHYAPGYGSRGAAEGDLRTILDGAYLRRVAQDGLFALSFMENDYVTASEHGYGIIRKAVRRYGSASP